MTTPDTDSLSRFDACWLAEAVRLHALDTADPLAPRLAATSLDEEALLQITQAIAHTQGYSARARQWHRHARLVLAGLGLVALAGGFSAGLSFFSGAAPTVNVLWTLIGLLGVHTVALLLWLVAGQATGGVAGRVWFWLLQRWPLERKGGTSETDPLGRAMLLMLGRRGLGRWWLGTITHGLWLLALAASLLAMLAVLSLRNVSFTLETTILPAAVFAGFVEGFGWLPSLLGFAVPDPAMIQAALSGAAPGGQNEMAGRAWASWLSGGMLVYAFLPRALAFAFCYSLQRRRRTQCRPDLLQPGFALLPGAQTAHPGIVDPAPPASAPGRVAPLHHVRSSGAMLCGLELGSDISWPPRGMGLGQEIRVDERVDSREQRRALLSRLKAAPPAKLLLTVDARLSPDRGTLHWLVEISHFAGELRVLLLPPSCAEERRLAWLQGLESTGLSGERVFTDAAQAGHWLNPHD